MQLCDRTCPFCLKPFFDMRIDKKSRPYFKCRNCELTVFANSFRNAARYLATEPYLARLAEKLATNENEAAETAKRERTIMAAILGAVTESPGSVVGGENLARGSKSKDEAV